MAKKTDVTAAPEPKENETTEYEGAAGSPDTGAGNEFVPGDGDSLGIQDDFDVDSEYKPIPLIPQGTYHGAVTEVKFDPEEQCIIWEVTLNENGGIKNDGESPIDGTIVYNRNYLPKPGDEKLPAKSGNGTKRQGKINMLKQFADDMKINMSKPVFIANAILNKEWIGLAVDVLIKIGEYEGRFRNEVKNMKARQS